jgi:hypothetical protein
MDSRLTYIYKSVESMMAMAKPIKSIQNDTLIKQFLDSYSITSIKIVVTPT